MSDPKESKPQDEDIEKGKYKATQNRYSDSTGTSYGNYDYGTNDLYQQNSKTPDGEHTYYNVATGAQGWHGANQTEEDKENSKYFKNKNKED